MKKKYIIIVLVILVSLFLKQYLFNKYEKNLNGITRIFEFKEAYEKELIESKYVLKKDNLNNVLPFVQLRPIYIVDFLGGVVIKPSGVLEGNLLIIEQEENIKNGVVLCLEKEGVLNLDGDDYISVYYTYDELKSFYNIDFLKGSPDSIKVYLHEYRKVLREDDEIYNQLKGFISSQIFISKRLIDSTYLYKTATTTTGPIVVPKD